MPVSNSCFMINLSLKLFRKQMSQFSGIRVVARLSKEVSYLLFHCLFRLLPIIIHRFVLYGSNDRL